MLSQSGANESNTGGVIKVIFLDANLTGRGEFDTICLEHETLLAIFMEYCYFSGNCDSHSST